MKEHPETVLLEAHALLREIRGHLTARMIERAVAARRSGDSATGTSETAELRSESRRAG